jgi:hypothetical protein
VLNYIMPLIFSLNGIMLHDFHISVCEIEYDQESKALEITHRIFLDDLEQTLISWSGNSSIDVYNPKDSNELKELIGKYILEKFSVKVNDNKEEMVFIGSEAEDDIMYCYVELPKVNKFESIHILNTVLMDKFDDQINMVHIYRGDKTTSTKFSKENTTFMMDFEDN